jgi:hypothetical protein
MAGLIGQVVAAAFQRCVLPLLAGCVAAGALVLIEVCLPPNHSLHRTRPFRRASQNSVGRAGELRIR